MSRRKETKQNFPDKKIKYTDFVNISIYVRRAKLYFDKLSQPMFPEEVEAHKQLDEMLARIRIIIASYSGQRIP